MRKESGQAWQHFCEVSIVVSPVELALAPGFLQVAMQGTQPDLYQHRLPQLGSRMQQLLTEAGTAWQSSDQGRFCGQSTSCKGDSYGGLVAILQA